MNKQFDILKKPILSEKSLGLAEEGKYTFAVDKRANKIEIKEAIEKIFGVKVASVNTMNYPKKAHRVGRHSGYKAGYKKAIIKLSEGTIPDFTV